MTEIYNGCFKTGNIPKDGEAVNVVLGVGGGGICLVCLDTLYSGKGYFFSFSFSFCKTELQKNPLIKQKNGDRGLGDRRRAPKDKRTNSRDV